MHSYKPRTVCVFGYDDEGGRTWTVVTGLSENGVIVKPCTVPRSGGFFTKLRDLYRTWYASTDEIDAIYVLFMGYYLMPLAWYLARRRGIPVILDALVSQYDTEVVDRKRLSRFHPKAWPLWWMDFFSCFLADAIVVDTHEHQKFFAKKFFVATKKILVIPVGCRSDLFKPLPHEKESEDDFVVEFYGSFTPLQGVEYIMEAAKILQDKNERVHFEIIGNGQLFNKITSMAEKFHLGNVKFLGTKPLQELPHFIAHADVCLGIFGTTKKARRVIPHKVYECLSCGKPVITERSPGAIEILTDYDGVCMVDPGSSAALAEKILELKYDETLRTKIGERARAISLKELSPRLIVRPLVDWLG